MQGVFDMAESMMTVKEAARLWGLTERRIAGLCKDKKIEGARKEGKSWLIPSDAVKPADSRIKSGHYKKMEKKRLPLPIGVSDYRLASSKYYYVDKTMLIKDFLDEQPMVSLFTRPRRFGKTLAMDMLRTFFEKSDEDTSVYFKDKKVWSFGEEYRAYQGKYPVIFLTFKDVKFETWEESLESIRSILRREFARHSELGSSSKCSSVEKESLQNLISGTASNVELAGSLSLVSQMLDEHYGVAPIIIIDEYDIPIQQGYMMGFYEKVTPFMRNLFSGAFKDNRHLSYGFLTGVLRVAKESIFSGLNNLAINSVLDSKYSNYFGFTSDEVRKMAQYYGVSSKFDEICDWYDGYNFGGTDIFNPWSVINYFSNECKPRAFWQSTGTNEIIGEIIARANEEVYSKLTSLVNGASFSTYIDTGVIYPQIKSNPSTIYSFLLVAGYLKVLKSTTAYNGDFICEVALPNKEITFVYNKEILRQLETIIPSLTAASIQEAIYSGDGVQLQSLIQTLLTQSVSYYDTAGENFYHGFLLGLCAVVGGAYVTSNRESGDGRYDIQMLPKNSDLPGILIELKAAKESGSEGLERLAESALEQIVERGYEAEMRALGVTTIYKYGVAFSGKMVAVVANPKQ